MLKVFASSELDGPFVLPPPEPLRLATPAVHAMTDLPRACVLRRLQSRAP